MGALVVGLAVAALLVWVARPPRRRGVPGPAAMAPGDGPSRLLGWAVGALPADRAPWGQAMFGELHQMDNRRQRWRFAVGCAGAAVFLPSRRADSAALAARLVAAAALACAGLVAYSLAHYPAILTRGNTWPVLAVFTSVLVAYTAIAAVLVRRGPVARTGLVSGLALAAVWIVAGLPVVSQASSPAYSLLLLAIPIAALTAGAAAARRSGTAAVRQQIALFSALVAGLLIFLTYAGDILLTAGGPYDAGQLRDFPGSGQPDLATYAVNDSLGSAMMLLLLVPAVTAAIASTGAGIAARLPRHGTSPS
ncbi:MAG TPA: hypothetical protein VGD29_06380 [Actinoplanes sp.]